MGEHDAFGGSSGGTFLVRRPSKKKLQFSGFEPGTKISLEISASPFTAP